MPGSQGVGPRGCRAGSAHRAQRLEPDGHGGAGGEPGGHHEGGQLAEQEDEEVPMYRARRHVHEEGVAPCIYAVRMRGDVMCGDEVAVALAWLGFCWRRGAATCAAAACRTARATRPPAGGGHGPRCCDPGIGWPHAACVLECSVHCLQCRHEGVGGSDGEDASGGLAGASVPVSAGGGDGELGSGSAWCTRRVYRRMVAYSQPMKPNALATAARKEGSRRRKGAGSICSVS